MILDSILGELGALFPMPMRKQPSDHHNKSYRPPVGKERSGTPGGHHKPLIRTMSTHPPMGENLEKNRTPRTKIQKTAGH